MQISWPIVNMFCFLPLPRWVFLLSQFLSVSAGGSSVHGGQRGGTTAPSTHSVCWLLCCHTAAWPSLAAKLQVYRQARVSFLFDPFSPHSSSIKFIVLFEYAFFFLLSRQVGFYIPFTHLSTHLQMRFCTQVKVKILTRVVYNWHCTLIC